MALLRYSLKGCFNLCPVDDDIVIKNKKIRNVNMSTENEKYHSAKYVTAGDIYMWNTAPFHIY